ncbi:unnamed protein product [Plutella xylostella]|uniref:(diamondback moth) hypothetical protein n=1 Tax=Plutella xylostella TaxID=51655 RepID=A0A8S4FY73_PLUXY|nr:unnamed protein product [Plutella xylostella]
MSCERYLPRAPGGEPRPASVECRSARRAHRHRRRYITPAISTRHHTPHDLATRPARRHTAASDLCSDRQQTPWNRTGATPSTMVSSANRFVYIHHVTPSK